MSDCRVLDDIIKHIKVMPDPTAKEKARAAFMQKAEEVSGSKETARSMEVIGSEGVTGVTGSEGGSKPGLLKNKRLIYSFVSGMAAMLILVIGMLSAINPEFLSGTVSSAGYYEINSPYAPFENGYVLSVETLQAMKASGNKFKLYMINGLALYLDTVDEGPVTLQYDLIPDAKLAKLLQSAAGGSIVTLKMESGFSGIPVKYEIDLTRGVLDEMSDADRQKWLSGLYVYCYIIDRNQLDRYIKTGSSDAVMDTITDAIIREDKMLPVKIVGGALHVNTDPNLYDAGKDILMFTLQEIDT